MEKEKFISKFNIKDYNNQLEKILSKKTFSENTKNLLLSMLYKVENSYDDYNLVTQDTKTKSEILEEILKIIEQDCDTIEVIKEQTSSSNIKEKKIITYLNIRKMLYEIYQIKSVKFKVLPEYEIIKDSLEKTLNQGYSISANEIIRDFDGWTWNIEVNEIENLKANLVYQTLKILVGNEFLIKWQESEGQDYIVNLQNELQKRYKEELSENLFKVINQIAIINVIENNREEKEKLINLQESLQNEFDKLNNKKEYLEELGIKKKKIVEEIKKIDETISNDRNLKEEFITRNEKLDMNHRIFSLSDFVEILEKERDELKEKLNICNKKMEPLIFIKTKNEVENKLQLIKEINLQNINEKIYNTKVKELLDLVNRAIKIKIDYAMEREEIKKLIYQIRYYTSIYVKKDKQIKDLVNTDNIQKEIITKACKQRYITIFSPDIKQNYEIVKNIFQTDIIELEKIYFKFMYKDNQLELKMYDEENLYKTFNYENVNELNVKLNKKIKVFV